MRLGAAPAISGAMQSRIIVSVLYGASAAPFAKSLEFVAANALIYIATFARQTDARKRVLAETSLDHRLASVERLPLERRGFDSLLLGRYRHCRKNVRM